jgi:general secretion pathway protein L
MTACRGAFLAPKPPALLYPKINSFMSIATQDLRLFGLDLPAAWGQLRQAWLAVMQHPMLRWVGPRPAILLQEGQNAEGLWEPLQGPLMQRHGDVEAKKRPLFSAIALPEEMVLRKQLMFPKLDEKQLRSAIELQAETLSPFPATDLLWISGPLLPAGGEGKFVVELVITSRQAVARYLSMRTDKQPEAPEVWVRAGAHLTQALVLPGFGEERRLRAQRRGWSWLLGGGVLMLMLAGGLAVTPTLQLRARALQASSQLERLVEQTKPLLGKREALMAANVQLEALGGITSNRLDPLTTMHTLTKVLGDDTMLQRLQIEGRNVLIVGQTPDTATMMQELSAQPGFKGVRAPSAATRPPGAPKEIFQVEFTVQDAPAEGAEPAATTSAAEEAKS